MPWLCGFWCFFYTAGKICILVHVFTLTWMPMVSWCPWQLSMGGLRRAQAGAKTCAVVTGAPCKEGKTRDLPAKCNLLTRCCPSKKLLEKIRAWSKLPISTHHWRKHTLSSSSSFAHLQFGHKNLLIRKRKHQKVFTSNTSIPLAGHIFI